MTSREYWSGRAEQNALRAYQFSLRRAQLVTRWFGRASREMQKKVNSFYRDYAGGEGISLKAAKALLTDRRALALTREAAERLSALYPDDPELHRLLRQASLQRAVAREEFLKIQLQLLASELYGETAGELRRTLTEAFEDAYYHGLYDFQQFVGYGSAFNRISTHQLEAAVTAKWSGKNYSERLWGDHRVSLARYLDRIVTTGFLEGQPSTQMTAQLQKAMNTSAYRARALIRTESAQIASRASLLSYRENGTPQFQFLATLDLKTSEVCRAMDGKVFETADGKVGVNMPPLHPHCRSTTVPYVPNAEFDRDDTRAARGKDGRTYKVPASMTYQEWHREHVEADPEWQLAETKLKNGRADAEQYDRYRALLGKDAPKSFDGYQTMKYTDKEGLSFLQLDYRRRARLRQNPALALPHAAAATAAEAKFVSYLFGGQNSNGLQKGRAITSRLGYDHTNWIDFREEILRKAPLYPATFKRTDQYGHTYEQKIVVNGLLGTPANVVVGWKVKDGKAWMASAYIKEVKD